ncbi:MAG: methionyl-tRNA formyltransferase [candidate division Zixibacteria bacterium]|nr:methionyl-tRNA formyltransferase [candidate division Zixibacteria bacterium]
MRLVFMGTPAFALPSLERIHRDGHEIASVVTNPDKPSGRGRKLKPPEVKQLAKELNLDTIQPRKLSDPVLVEKLTELQPELFVVVAFRILPKKLLKIPSFGSVNLHASLLPKYRGAAPINWAIINGETETGVTTFLIKPKVDTGDILLQRKYPIAPDDTYGELYERLSHFGADLLSNTLELIEKNRISPVSQNEGEVTRAPKITRDICRLDFARPADEVANLIRGLSPKPAAFTFFRGKEIKIVRAQYTDVRVSGEIPGTVKVNRNIKELMVACADTFIKLKELQPEGKKVMTSAEFINGYQPQDGEMMGDSIN